MFPVTRSPASMNAASPTVISAVTASVVRLLPHQWYSSAAGTQNGNPMRVALRSSALAAWAEKPRCSRLAGIHCWNPYWVAPMPSASSMIAPVSPRNGRPNRSRDELACCRGRLAIPGRPAASTSAVSGTPPVSISSASGTPVSTSPALGTPARTAP
ncbi:MAG TPA: hypothetical protein VFB06_03425 [Streptosporangiaceae bacterium]|nr:hypothetical protein [Streptosporangiaceae bacterium]